MSESPLPRALRISAFAALGLLSGCISGTQPTDTYVDHSGTTTVIENDREQCTHSCNEEYSRCMDTGAAHTNPAGMPSGMVGATADCSADLRSCLPGCKAR